MTDNLLQSPRLPRRLQGPRPRARRDQALHAQDQRQSRAVHPDGAARMGPCPGLSHLRSPRRPAARLAAPVQLASPARQPTIPNPHHPTRPHRAQPIEAPQLVVRRQHLIPSADLGDDAVWVSGPDEGLGHPIVLGEIAIDGGLEVDQRVEHAASEPPPGERGEEGLDRVGPSIAGGDRSITGGAAIGRWPRGAGGRREVKGPAGVAGEPGTDFGVLVGGADGVGG